MWIETPVLQVVLTRLWDEEKKHGSRHLRLATLKNLGGAPKILRTHLDRTMRKLRWRERRIAADIFGYLVTPSGGKIAHTVSDLASYSRCRKSRLALLLERLADSKIRVLRTIPPPPGEPEGVRYEIFHDVLAAAILTWRRRQVRLATCLAGGLLGTRRLSAIFYAFGGRGIFFQLVTKVRKFVEKGQIHREKAKADLGDETNPIKDVNALRNLSLALNYNRSGYRSSKDDSRFVAATCLVSARRPGGAL